ncbi:MAG: uridine kinase [Legionellaceae bacterium]|nr:uridine kinase [Legionellaceae bacterium]
MKTTLIAIAGASGSGKTTIAHELHQYYSEDQCLTISSDNYYNDLRHITPQERDNINFDHPNSIDFELLTQHLQQLKQAESIDMPTYDFATHARQEQTLRVSPKAMIIIEGILILHHAYLTALYDIKLFVDADADICLIRRLRRDITKRGRNMEDILTQYTHHVKPMFDVFVEPCKSSADLVINTTNACDITPLIAQIDSKTKAAQRVDLSMFADRHTATPQAKIEVDADEIYQGDYTYWS